VCQNQTIADSNATLAQDLRREVREMIAAGKTDAEIREFMIERYGDFVLYRPRMTAQNFLLWAAPALLLLIAAVVVVRVVRRRAQEADIEPEGPEAGQS
jgi:cytochrome c-type biogenesis protein CcmH